MSFVWATDLNAIERTINNQTGIPIFFTVCMLIMGYYYRLSHALSVRIQSYLLKISVNDSAKIFFSKFKTHSHRIILIARVKEDIDSVQAFVQCLSRWKKKILSVAINR